MMMTPLVEVALRRSSGPSGSQSIIYECVDMELFLVSIVVAME